VNCEAAKAKEEAIARTRISNFDNLRTVAVGALSSRPPPRLKDLVLPQIQSFQRKANESLYPFVLIDCRRRVETQLPFRRMDVVCIRVH
jgi:hypothetical protein